LPDKSYALGKTAYTPLSTFSYELRTRTEDKPQYVYLSHLGGGESHLLSAPITGPLNYTLQWSENELPLWYQL